MNGAEGRVWFLPVGSEDYVRVTDDLMSYELDGELRLVESAGTVDRVEFTDEDDTA